MTPEQIEIFAYSLAYRFLPETDKPWKGDTRKAIEFELLVSSTPSLDTVEKILRKELKRVSKPEQQYLDSVESWKTTITFMLDTLGDDQTIEYLSLVPHPIPGINTVAQHPGFTALNDYLILRRDVHNCPAEELGNLAMLLTTYQRNIKLNQ